MQYTFAILVLLIAAVFGDVYLHNPRGSNGRVEENNVNRQTGNRLMDTQNNAKGGYCKGPAMSFYEGSLLMVEWTNQHGCGQNGKLYCNVVLQYMCSNSDAPIENLVRDGVTTDRITDDEAGVTAVVDENSQNNNNNIDDDSNIIGVPLYGMHENLAYYQACSTRNRNEGLWINDRNLNQGNARSTRQNNGGGRNGLECPEERDYYPYWAPTPWRDVAILTHDTTWCEFYQKESQNVKSRFFCADAETGEQAAPNNEAECRQENHIWTEVPAWNIPAPECVPAPFGRDNHLGESGQTPGVAANYNWTLPRSDHLECIAADNCNCVLRIRYNISTTDLGPDGNRPDSGFIDWTSNAGASPILEDPIVEQDGQAFTLAINTNQFGRTFQDRSHVFHIRPRPDGVASKARIFNLNVRGKRGNIVQAYPSVEYDFIPDHFIGRAGDYMHFQWTGCDNNPGNNAGEGTASTDRSNMVQIVEYGSSLPATDEELKSMKPLFETPELRRHMAMAGQVECKSREELEELANDDPENCLKLNKAPEYFDGGLIKFNTTGKYHYMSTRNNSFTNRGQKGVIEIVPLLPTWAIVVVVIGSVLFALAGVLAGLVFYAKANPSSPLATTFEKM